MSTRIAQDVVPALQLSSGEIAFYRNEGYLLPPGLISEDRALSLRDEVLAMLKVIGLEVSKLKQTSEYLAGSGLDAFINNANLLLLAEQLMGGPSTIWLSPGDPRAPTDGMERQSQTSLTGDARRILVVPGQKALCANHELEAWVWRLRECGKNGQY